MVNQRIKNDVFLYVEGGGSGAGSASLQSEMRNAFADFFGKTALGVSRRPRVVACGGREQAFDMFSTATKAGKNALLLVDSEELVSPAHSPPPDGNWKPWAHLQTQAAWKQPVGANDDACHLMVPCMENWFLADPDAVGQFFGHGFRRDNLPGGLTETVEKSDVYGSLQLATRACHPKGAYGKGPHSFKLLALIDPAKVMRASPWASRLVSELVRRKD
jgi:hypothetical protein